MASHSGRKRLRTIAEWILRFLGIAVGLAFVLHGQESVFAKVSKNVNSFRKGTNNLYTTVSIFSQYERNRTVGRWRRS